MSSSSPTTDKVLSYGDYIIRESEIKLLLNNEWLNDPIIGFYFNYLSDHYSTDRLCMYIGPEVAQLLKLVPVDQIPAIISELMEDLSRSKYIFIAVNNSAHVDVYGAGTHWSLLVFSRRDNAFIHFDSCNNANVDDAKELTNKLKPFISSSAKFNSDTDCLKQSNGFDCGMHVICNAQLISDEVKKDSSKSLGNCQTSDPQRASQMRRKLVELIHKLAKESKE